MKFLRIVILFYFILIFNAINASSQEKEIDVFLNDLLKFVKENVDLDNKKYEKIALDFIKDNRKIFFSSFSITNIGYDDSQLQINADVWLDTSDNSILQYHPATNYLLKLAQENNFEIDKYDDASGIHLNVNVQSYVAYESDFDFEGKSFIIKLITHEKEIQDKLAHGQSYDLYFDLCGFILIFSEAPDFEIRGILTQVLTNPDE